MGMNHSSISDLTFSNSPKKTVAILCIGVASLILSGCASTGLFSERTAGISSVNAHSLSKAALDSRAAYTNESLPLIPREARAEVKEEGRAQASLSLVGKSLSSANDKNIKIELFTDKINYSTGYVKVLAQDNAGQDEFWPIIAHDNVGSHSGVFEYIYILSLPRGGIRYLVLNGGPYANGEKKYTGFEGSLIEPGSSNNTSEPDKVVKIDFGFNFPTPPIYAEDTDLADDVVDVISGKIAAIKSTKAKIIKTKNELAQLQSTETTPEKEAKKQLKIQGLEKKVTELQDELTFEIESTQTRLLDYFGLRQQISNNYDSFIKSNHFHWADESQKQDYRNTILKMVAIDKKVHTAYNAFLEDSPDKQKLDVQHNNMTVLIDLNKDFDKTAPDTK
ncbi:MAG: hypothetical protein KKA70_04605 [Proteobacteria bacterium]|nr:hypothetical protein [Pseudomonadota bacterium]